MKKEIEITFECSELLRHGGVCVDILIDGVKFGYFVINNNDVVVSMLDCLLKMLNIPSHNLESYLQVDDIRKIYDARFKKGEHVDLFAFVEKNDEQLCYVESDGDFVFIDAVECSNSVEHLKQNYNIFPTIETCINASVMSLDERKQYLFAIAKGYEVCSMSDAIMNYNENLVQPFQIIRNVYNKLEVHEAFHNVSSNILFMRKQDAIECAVFMSGK